MDPKMKTTLLVLNFNSFITNPEMYRSPNTINTVYPYVTELYYRWYSSSSDNKFIEKEIPHLHQYFKDNKNSKVKNFYRNAILYCYAKEYHP